jgi:hypothetical protein
VPITTTTTPAPSDLLATVKMAICELEITDEDQNARLERLIRRASARIRSLTNRVYGEERVTETVRSHGRTQLLLERTPLVEIHEVTFDGEVITDYEIKNRGAGTLYRRAGWVWTAGLMPWGSGIEDFPAPGSEEARFAVDYTAGYVLPSFPSSFTPNANSVDMPEDIEDFCLQLVKVLYYARASDPSLASEKIGDYSYAKDKGVDSGFFELQARFVEKWGRIK